MNTNHPSRLFPFLIGLAFGVLGTIYLPAHVRPYLPSWMAGKTIVVKGTVAAKQKKEKVLLLTVNTPEGALLATFTRKADEVNLLVNEKDTIEITVPKYMPFVDDPGIVRVVKEEQHSAPPEPSPDAKPRESNAKEMKPARHEKLPEAAPVPAPGK